MKRISKVSSADVAKAAGVSRTTVSYVLNGVGAANIPQATRERVLEVANQLGYRVNTLAKGLKSGRTALIGVFCRVREDNFHERVAHGVYNTCYEVGYNVLFAYIGPSQSIEEESLQRMLDYNVSGIVRIVSGKLQETELLRLHRIQEEEGIPTVFIDDATHADHFDCVVSDDLAGSMAVMNHLIEIGHRRIGYVDAGNGTSTARIRREGYFAGLQLGGMTSDPELIQGRSYHPADQLAAIRALLAKPNRPTALFCPNDVGASIAREVAREMRLLVPNDLALVGYGDSDSAQYGGLTSVAQDPEELGRLGVRRILERQDSIETTPLITLVPTKLLVRPSTIGGNFSLIGGTLGDPLPP